ncbi:MAG TPA: class I SAM-dependent methyltransferase [Pirellulaceae bacterium]|nr:class I SAM-dependent methyltransferase [Pirellulaceae bacterium]
MNDPTPAVFLDIDGFSLEEWKQIVGSIAAGSSRKPSPTERAFGDWQDRLRGRATKKFPQAETMLFSETLLQQASSLAIGRYKARRFAGVGPVADLCCGLGGDLIALAEVGEAIGVDRHPVAALLARHNLAAQGLTADVVECDVEAFDLDRVAAWHVDPDRRTATSHERSSRTVHLESFSPDVEWLREALRRRPDACVKLAPATPVPDDLAALGTREWVGAEGETKQQLLWAGQFRDATVGRAATLLNDEGQPVAQFASDGGDADGEEETCELADGADAFAYEPHSALLTAGLAERWAASNGLARVAFGVEYFVGPAAIASPWSACFAVEEELPFDRRKLKAYLRERNVGTLEIKVRRARVVPEELRRELKVPGDESRTLLVYAEPSGKHRVIIARRIAVAS